MEEYKWFIRINDKTIGPFSSLEVAKNKRCDFETPIWREGFDKWVLIKDVPELVLLMKKERKKANWWVEEINDFDLPKKVNFKKPMQEDEEIALDMKKDPFFFMIIFIILIISLIFLFTFKK